ncbi:carbamoyl phosphate synthase preATP-grasp domain-containing protein [Shigella flexneri]
MAEVGITGLNAEFLRQLKRKGFADARLAKLAGVREAEIRKLRDHMTCTRSTARGYLCGRVCHQPLTCTPLMKKSAKRIRLPTVKKSWCLAAVQTVSVGIEFDYCCVHASLALREDGYETIMVNCKKVVY